MYRYESDYVMRMIHLLRLLYEYLAGLTDEQQREAGEDAIRDAMAKLTGLTPDAALTLTTEQLGELLGEDGEGIAKRFALAELLRAQGDIFDRFSFAEDADRSYLRALALYLSANEAPEELLEGSYIPIARLFHRYFSDLTDGEHRQAGQLFEAIGCYADAEDAFCAQSDHEATVRFYRRLRQVSEEKIVAGGLTPDEVKEGFLRACRLCDPVG